MNRTIRDFKKNIEVFEILKIPSEELREPTKDSKKIQNSLIIRNKKYPEMWELKNILIYWYRIERNLGI